MPGPESSTASTTRWSTCRSRCEHGPVRLRTCREFEARIVGYTDSEGLKAATGDGDGRKGQLHGGTFFSSFCLKRRGGQSLTEGLGVLGGAALTCNDVQLERGSLLGARAWASMREQEGRSRRLVARRQTRGNHKAKKSVVS